MVGVVTLLGLLLGDELSQGLLALDPIRVMYGLELWRPFTAACFLGPPSIGWLMNAYYLFEYGSSLERAFGTTQHLLFLLLQIGFLSLFSAFFGQPFFAQSVITSMLHVLSRSMPNQQVKWLIFTVPYWTLPYGLMASDVLQAGNAAAALPHVLGILSGHLYYFHKKVWPKEDGGEDWLVPPAFLSKVVEGGDRSKGKDSISAALKMRKKGKGKKLGS
jgi:membrane associated rhomboid family serine protease